MKRIIIGVLAFIVIAGLFVGGIFLAISLGRQKVVAQTATSVSFSGFNGYGTVTVKIDKTIFEKQALGENNSSSGEMASGEIASRTSVEVQEENKYKSGYEAVKLNFLKELEDSFKFSLDNNKNLSNGDTVRVTMSYDKKLAWKANVKIIGDLSFDVTVSGLSSYQAINPFDNNYFDVDDGYGVVFNFDGVSPYANLEIKNNMKVYPYSYIIYTASKNEDLASGEIITVTASLPREVQNQGYYLTENTVEYTCKNIPKYRVVTYYY